MKQLVSTEILISFLILLLLSNLYYIFFEKTGMILVILAGVLLIFISQYFRNKLRGLVLFWSGLILLLFALLSNPYNLILLFSFLIILAVRYLVLRRNPVHVIATSDDLHIYKQHWFNRKETPAEVYKFDDINLQHAVGDIYIDLTNAANLTDNSVVVVHNIVGKTTIVVPHHYQTKIDYSSLFGQLKVDDDFTQRSRNERLNYMSPKFENDVMIKIIVSSIVGDLEVIHR